MECEAGGVLGGLDTALLRNMLSLLQLSMVRGRGGKMVVREVDADCAILTWKVS
jgi:hypothetical protein